MRFVTNVPKIAARPGLASSIDEALRTNGATSLRVHKPSGEITFRLEDTQEAFDRVFSALEAIHPEIRCWSYPRGRPSL